MLARTLRLLRNDICAKEAVTLLVICAIVLVGILRGFGSGHDGQPRDGTHARVGREELWHSLGRRSLRRGAWHCLRRGFCFHVLFI